MKKWVIEKKGLLGWAAILTVFGLCGTAYADSGYLNQFRGQYGTGLTNLFSCQICHTSAPALNSYGDDFLNAGVSLTAIEGLDSDGDGSTNIVEIQALTNPGDAASRPAPAADTAAPVVTAFTVPATSTSLTVSITSLTATDNVAVTGYRVTETPAVPAAGAAGWTATVPANYTFASGGAKTLYGWAKDAAGNVSVPRSAAVTINVPDTTPPLIGAFTVPATSTSLTVSITSLTATDNTAVTGYMVTETSTVPAAAAAGWTAAAPASYTFASAGAKTLYGWAKDAAGNVSVPLSRTTTITLADATAPVVTAFTVPAASGSLIVSVTGFTATDSVGVTGYLITATPTAPSPAPASGWTTTAPTSYTFSSAGAKTLYGWAKDAAGNVSVARSATTTITLADTTAPVVGAFTIPATATSLIVPVGSLTATDSVGVTGYLVTETSAAPSPAPASGWTATAPTSYTFSSAGAKTLYGWAKDAAGNVSVARSAATTITLPDTIAPVVNGIIIPSTSASLTVAVTTFVATDDTAVTGYLVTESPAAPTPAASAGWTSTPPASYTFSSGGAKTLYAWAKDAAGNVSAPVSATTTVSQLNQAAIGATGADAEATLTAPDTTAGNGSGGGCFIATAAFGSYLDPHVTTLRAFRDSILMTNRAGRTFVAWYYRVSPDLADEIAHNGIARSFVRIALLPVIAFGALTLAVGFVPGLLLLAALLASMWFASRSVYSRL